MAIEWNIGRDIGGECSTRSVDGLIAALAGGQHGVVARGQLIALGVGGDRIDHRIARGRLHPVHRGVFAVGHRVLSREGAWMAAVLAAGPDAVLSHRSAAALWGVRDTRPAVVEVTLARKLRRPGIRAHRVALAPDEVDRHRGIPVTTVARTLLDLAEVIGARQVEHAVHEAEFRRLASPTSLDALIARNAGRRGTTALRRILEDRAAIGRTITKSELEKLFLAVLDEHGVPRPRTNTRVGPFEADAVWPEQRLIAELDSYAAHATRRNFESDRARDRRLVADGWRVVRITWRQLEDDPGAIAREVSSGLATPPPRSARHAPPPPPATPATRSAAP